MTKQINYEEEPFDFEELEMVEDEEEWPEPMGTMTSDMKKANGFEFRFLNGNNSKRSVFFQTMDLGTAHDRFEKKFPTALFINAKMAYYNI